MLYNHVLWIVGHQLQSCRRFRLFGQAISTDQSLKNFEDSQQESKNKKNAFSQDKHIPLNNQRCNSTTSIMLLLRVGETIVNRPWRNVCRIFFFQYSFYWKLSARGGLVLNVRSYRVHVVLSLLATHQWTAKAILRHHLVHPVFIFLCCCSCATHQPAQPWLISDILTHSIKEFLNCRKPRKCQYTGSIWMTLVR